MIDLHLIGSKVVSKIVVIADRLFDHLDLIPAAYSAMTDTTVLVLLPLIAILTALPSKRRYAAMGLSAISYLFGAFVWASSVIADYLFFRSRLFIEMFLCLGVGLALVSVAVYLLRGTRPDLPPLGRRALLFLFVAGPVLISPVVYLQQGMWPDLVSCTGLVILLFIFRAAAKRDIAGGMTGSHRVKLRTPVSF